MDKNIQIGQALKSLRLKNNLTQKEMAAGVMSESFYSKIERDIHKVDAETLIRLLLARNFDLSEFFEKFSTKIQHPKSHNPDLAKIRLILAQNNPIDPDYLKMLSHALTLMNTEEAYTYITRAFQAYENHPSENPEIIANLGHLGAASLHYGWMKKVPYKQMMHVCNFIRDILPNDAGIGFEKIIASYYDSLLHGDIKKAEKILNVLQDSDYVYLVKDTLVG